MEVDNHQRWNEQTEECLKGIKELREGEKSTTCFKKGKKENQRVQ